MLFQTLDFLVFFTVVAAFYFLFRGATRRWLLLFASYYFYMAWDPRFVALILASTAIDFVAGIRIEEAPRPSRRRLWLVLSLASNLGILAFFKYLGFFGDVTQTFLDAFGIDRHIEVWNVILPVGISFFTFQSMSHTIDVYRREIPAERSFLRFAIFVAFFPQLVAGPIVRARDFLPQLRVVHRFDAEGFTWGIERFLTGLVKKVVIADNLSPIVDVVFASPSDFDTPMVWLAAFAYSVQIYADFSGYSDMAIGLARILGFRIPENFDFPYLARSPREFWRRWHISLSTWLRDYLYISLGGNRRGRWMTQRNLMITMLLGGLWHGADYRFVLWGGCHGLLLVLGRFSGRLERWTRHLPARPLLAVLAMNTIVATLWVFFRATNFGDALTMLRMMYWDWSRSFDVTMLQSVDLPFTFAILSSVVFVHVLHAGLPRALDRVRESLALRSCAWGLMLFLTLQLRYDGQVPFVYFQF